MFWSKMMKVSCDDGRQVSMSKPCIAWWRWCHGLGFWNLINVADICFVFFVFNPVLLSLLVFNAWLSEFIVLLDFLFVFTKLVKLFS